MFEQESFLVRVGVAMNKIRNISLAIKGLPLNTEERKLVAMFFELAFHPKSFMEVAGIIGIDEFEKFAACSDISELLEIVKNCSLFTHEKSSEVSPYNRTLITLVSNWRKLAERKVDLDGFLKGCIDDYIPSENDRKYIYKKYGIES
jgi:hypothetical protein